MHIHHPLHQTAWYHVPEGLTVRSFLPLANGIAVRPRGQSWGGECKQCPNVGMR